MKILKSSSLILLNIYLMIRKGLRNNTNSYQLMCTMNQRTENTLNFLWYCWFKYADSRKPRIIMTFTVHVLLRKNNFLVEWEKKEKLFNIRKEFIASFMYSYKSSALNTNSDRYGSTKTCMVIKILRVQN